MGSDIETEQFDRLVAAKLDQLIVGKNWQVEKRGRIEWQSYNYFVLYSISRLF